MAFLHQHPRRVNRQQLSASPSTTSLSQSAQSVYRGDVSTHLDKDAKDSQDWSVVFPGRTKVDVRTTSSSSIVTDPASPFVSPAEEEEIGEESNVDLTLPLDQDGTGRFTRPSSPFYAADDEDDIGQESIQDTTISRHHGLSTSDSYSDDDSGLEEVEVTSSIFLSGSEMARRDSSSNSNRQRRRSDRESVISSSSWAWMNAESSLQSQQRERVRSSRHQSVLPVVFTSGSEGEEDDDVGEKREHNQRIREEQEEEAFEDALANTHSAQSAGLSARAPKRRHRKMGESAKGSKRSNSSAVIASDLQATRRRAGLRSRPSAASNVSARSKSRVRGSEQATSELASKQAQSQGHGLLDLVLRKLFSVEDGEVLQAFLRDEGPLRIEQSSHSSAFEASSALKVADPPHDEVWTRNERKRQMRRAHQIPREAEQNQEEQEDDVDDVPRVHLHLPPHGLDASQLFSSRPPRVRLESHVGEPSLFEALQATVFSSLSNVPSGLSVLLAGSHSVRFVNYLAGRLAGQIGPSLTERMRKLIDDAEDDTAIQDEVFGYDRTPSVSRFRGGSHPAISSRSSTTLTSRGPASDEQR